MSRAKPTQWPQPRAVVVLTGDELLRGFVQDANSGYLARSLRELSVPLERVVIVGDDRGALRDGLASVVEDVQPELVVVSGGLGPTHDDRTTEVVAELARRPLQLREDALAVVESRVRAFGRMRTAADAAAFEAGNRKQATVPDGAVVLEPGGTAPGYVVPASRAGTPVFVVLPGPPPELRYAWPQAVASEPMQRLLARVRATRERVVRVWGVPESVASEQLLAAGHEDDEACRVTLCARHGELELSIRGTDNGRVEELVDHLVRAFGEQAFAVDDERPVAELVGELLGRSGLTVAVAESCTGGLLGAMLTTVPGSSRWVRGGVIAYDNAVKVQTLGVEPEVLVRHGAVSEQVALAMAEGVLKVGPADLGVSITGVAGPAGGTDEKPVGTVWIALASASGATAQLVRLRGDREAIRQRAATAALHLVRDALTRN